MKIEQKPMFRKAYKKLHPNQKVIVNDEIRKVAANPSIGTEKKQDLKDVFVHKFNIHSQQYLLSYMFDPITLTLLFIGVHENYYKNLKKNLY